MEKGFEGYDAWLEAPYRRLQALEDEWDACMQCGQPCPSGMTECQQCFEQRQEESENDNID